MRFSQFTNSVTFISLCAYSHAWPLLSHQKRNPEPLPQSYSVVAVGGDSTANNAQPSTATITNEYTQTQVQTIIATVTVDGSASPTTIIQDVTVTITAETISTATIVVEPSVTSTPYDNGQWHTTYYKQVTTNGAWVPVSTIEPSPTSTSDGWVPVPTVASSVSTSSTSTASSTVQSPAVTSSASTSIDWATAYGTWHTAPVDGSWWGN